MRVSSLCVVALLPLLAAADVWTSCGSSSDVYQIQSISASPAVPVKGQPLTVTLVGTLASEVTGGLNYVKTVYNGFPVSHSTKDLCTAVEGSSPCPWAAGAKTISTTSTVPATAPAGKYDMTLTMTDQNGKRIMCVEGKWSL